MTERTTPPITFEDYHVCTDDDIKSLTAQGILLANGDFIDFAECAANFAALHGGSGKCVGERDISGSNPSFGFYTAPLTTHIFFMPRGLFGRYQALRRFRALQKQMEALGYTTYDIT